MQSKGKKPDIRSLLEPHGYRVSRTKAVMGDTVVFGELFLVYPSSTPWPPTSDDEETLWLNGLAHFLNDKAQTGARMDDIAAAGVYYEVAVFDEGISLHVPYDDDLGVVSKDADNAIAALWLKVHGLEDPRRSD